LVWFFVDLERGSEGGLRRGVGLGLVDHLGRLRFGLDADRLGRLFELVGVEGEGIVDGLLDGLVGDSLGRSAHGFFLLLDEVEGILKRDF
jgi:hypothetical protein